MPKYLDSQHCEVSRLSKLVTPRKVHLRLQGDTMTGALDLDGPACAVATKLL